MSAAVDTMELARQERTDLAEFLAGLTPQQWDAPTLCEGWRVRDVVAHAYSYDHLGFGRLAVRMVKAGLNGDRANAVGVAEHSGRSPDELVAMARECIRPRGLTSLMGGRIALTDGMIHHQDIRRPLGTPREIP
ncbi:MAG: maleylpyruvate isomerase family mycothiol-dependent enzyme, partial [Pseudonocardia sediminis]